MVPSLPAGNPKLETRNFPLLLRPYQQAAFDNRTNGLEVWLWGRQTGKSFTLAAWAVDRLLTRPGRLVTILSNSLANGAELNAKCAEICRLLDIACEQTAQPDASSAAAAPSLLGGSNSQFRNSPALIPSPALAAASFLYETRIAVAGQVGRIKVLPAHPRTARGFSGDLILDEFAFHENGAAIWEAAEPILSANKDFLCRIASTPNGRHNMFYRLATDPSIPLRRVPRSEAWSQGLPIFHPVSREPVTPSQARALAHDKRAYDQNYECVFEAENMALLTLDLIGAAEDPAAGRVEEGEWSAETRAFLQCEDRNSGCEIGQIGNAEGGVRNADRPAAESDLEPRASHLTRDLFVGVDVGRSQDLTVITLLEKGAGLFFVRAMLRLRGLRLPEQQALLEEACRSPRFAAAQIDMTGLGLGLFEYTSRIFGDRVRGLNFACSLPLDARVGSPGYLSHLGPRTSHLARAPEVLALRLLQIYEARRLRHPVDAMLRDDLRQPERVTRGDGRVSIVAARSGSSHADHFWSLALAVDCALRQPEVRFKVVSGIRPRLIPRRRLVV